LDKPVDYARPDSMAPKTGYFVSAILALGFADGVASFLLYPGQPFAPSSLVMSVVALFFTFAWYRLDSESRAFKRTPLLSIAVVGVGIVALPYYLFRTRGLRQGAIATLIFIFVVIGYSAMGYVGQLAARSLRT
jgi:hypothetical protein